MGHLRVKTVIRLRGVPRHLGLYTSLYLQMPGRDHLQSLMHVVRNSAAKLCPCGRLKASSDMLVADGLVQVTERRCKLPYLQQLCHGSVVSPQGEIGLAQREVDARVPLRINSHHVEKWVR